MEHAVVDFEAEARAAVHRVRQTLAEVIGEVGADARRPQSVADKLGLPGTLVWRVARVVTDEDALAAIAHLPGTTARRTLLQSCERAGANQERVEAARRAMDDFDRMVAAHAGDRETFARMLVGLPGERQAERDEAQRKLAFLGNSAIWGIEARLRLSTQVLTPSKAGEMLDLTAISGLVGFRWLRANVPWPVFARRYVLDDGTEIQHRAPEPIDGETELESPPLWREFCSPNLPPLHRTLDADGVARFELFGGAVGTTGQCTCVNAWTDRGVVPRFSTPDRPVEEHNVWCSTPVEALLFDLFIHRSIELAGVPLTRIISQLPGGPGGDRRVCELPVADKSAELSTPFDMTAPEFPVYPRMMERVFDHLGRDSTEYRAFRLRLPYPPIAARAQYQYQLPEKP